MALKFIEGEPPRPATHGAHDETRAALRANPGRWAELGRATKDKRSGLASRGTSVRRGQADIEAVVRTDGDEVVLYARAVTA